MTHHHHHHTVTKENEKKILQVIVFTVLTMIAEIAYGYLTRSMALLADGYHMGTHTLAFVLTYASYVLVRRFSGSEKFPDGAEKIGVLTAYTSAIFLGLTGVWILIEAVERFFHPVQIRFDEAILVSVIGLLVNAACVFIMERGHHHDDDEHHREDYNFKAAYYHILADALTSVLAIAALIVGKQTNIVCLDAVVGVLGGLLIVKWAFGLLKQTSVELVGMKI